MGQSSWTITPRFYSYPPSSLSLFFPLPFLPSLHHLFPLSFSFAFVVRVRISLFCFVLDLDCDRSYATIIVEDSYLPIVQKRGQLASQSNPTISWRVITPPPSSSPTQLPFFSDLYFICVTGMLVLTAIRPVSDMLIASIRAKRVLVINTFLDLWSSTVDSKRAREGCI